MEERKKAQTIYEERCGSDRKSMATQRRGEWSWNKGE